MRGLEQRQQSHGDPVLSNSNFPKRDRALVRDGILYKSKGERACAELLERYVEGWKAIEGKTYEVPTAFNRRADFKIGNLLLEWHPICNKWEADSKEAFKLIERGLQKANKEAKRKIREGLRLEFRARYEKKRKFAIDFASDPEIQACHLLVCCNAEEFCKALKQLGKVKKKLEVLVQEFRREMQRG